MFRKSSTIPQRNKFCLTRDQIMIDIESIYKNDEQRSKLYYCLDETPPKERKFEKIEEFLKGTQDLEKSANILESLKNELENSQKAVELRLSVLKEKVSDAVDIDKK